MQAARINWQEWINKGGSYSATDFEKVRLDSIKQVEEKRIAEDIEKLLKKIPMRFVNKEFSHYQTRFSEQTKVKKICEKFVLTFEKRLEEGTCLFFLGSPGTGKTLMSFILYQELAKLKYRVHYESSLKFLKVLQEKYYESPSFFKSQLEIYIHADFLVLDEVTESITKDGLPSECEKKLLFEIINSRYELKKRCTLVISNRDNQNLQNILGNQIFDRLIENGIILTFNWDSYRKNRGKVCC